MMGRETGDEGLGKNYSPVSRPTPHAPSWKRHLLIDTLLVAGWLGSVGMVLLHERGYVWGGAVNPLASLRATLEVNEQWFGLYYQGQKIGYTRTTLMPEERDGMPGVSVMERGRLSFTLLGSPQQVDLSAP